MAKTGLGKGLGSIFPTEGKIETVESESVNGGVLRIRLNEIKSNPYQPREEFDRESLEELANSIREKGVLQPVLVRKTAEGGYELIAGERRLEASRLAGKSRIPAIVSDVETDEDMLEYALIENIQRANLNPVEEAKAYHRLNKEFNLSHEEISIKVGKNRSTVTNLLRVLNLSPLIQELIVNNTISLGHAKVLLSVDDFNLREKLALKIEKENMSVRQLEKEIEKIRKQKETTKEKETDPFVEDVRTNLIHFLGTKVQINDRDSRGKIVIDYYSLDDLNRILDLIIKNREDMKHE